MIITISGKPGSGKTTVGKELARRLRLKFYSAGDIRGEMALKKGMTIDQLNKLGEKSPVTDEEVDDFVERLGREKDDFVIDSRLAFHFIRNSIKIFLDCDENMAAQRIFKAPKRPDERKYKNAEDTLKVLQEREKSDMLRYKKYYALDYTDKRHYDLMIDTTTLSVEEVVEQIVMFVGK